jgi:hypothetical protein
MSKRPGDPGYAAGWCIHYRYNRDVKKGEANTCEAGIDLDKFTGLKFGSRPCFLDETGASKADALPCERLLRPTAHEIAAHEKWAEGRHGLLGKVMKDIQPWREAHKGMSTRDVVVCPACSGRLHLSIAAYNGHVHGRCETEGCVSWME